jgi:hypothetical protein
MAVYKTQGFESLPGLTLLAFAHQDMAIAVGTRLAMPVDRVIPSMLHQSTRDFSY